MKVLMELHTRYNGSNNGKVSLSLDEAKRVLNLGKATVARGFDELQEKGFIVKIKKGQWYGRMANEWALTTKPRNGALATNDWKNWRPRNLDPRSPGGP
jgi:predicted transcriptional regulator